MNVTQVQRLNPYQDQLLAMGFSDDNGLEQLIGVAQVAGPELARHLGLSALDLAAMLNDVAANAAAIPVAAMNVIAQATYSLGVALDDIPAMRTAPATIMAPAHAAMQVDMSPQMPTVRDQAQRGTCVAHAALAIHEHQLLQQAAYQDMSEQFLYWNCKRNDGIPNTEGTWLAIALPLLQQDGCCPEATWQYILAPVPGNEGQGPAPGGAQLQALSFRVAGFKQLAPTSVPDIKAELASGHCVAFSIPVFNSWLRSTQVAYDGDITMPIPGEIRVGGHAMCLVGYVDLPHAGLGGGRFIVRNSWGRNWAVAGPRGPGYGTIPYAYIARMGSEAFSLT